MFVCCFSLDNDSLPMWNYYIKEINNQGFNIEFSDKKIANTLAESTGAKTALFYTCHNVSKEQFDKGETYVSLMRENLETLKATMS